MKVQALAILILSTLALADPTLGNDAGSHFDRDVVSTEAPEHATGDRIYYSHHERVNANLRSTPRRTLEVAVEESQRDYSISPVRNCRTPCLLHHFTRAFRAHQLLISIIPFLFKEMPLPVHEVHRIMTECGDMNGHFKIDLTTDNFGYVLTW